MSTKRCIEALLVFRRQTCLDIGGNTTLRMAAVDHGSPALS